MPGNYGPRGSDRGPLEKDQPYGRHLASGPSVCRLRLAGLIDRIEHANRYVLTPDGIKFAVSYTKSHNRLLRPLMAADQAQALPQLKTGPRHPEPACR